MYDFTVPMALMDFVPVFLFGAAAVLLQRDLYNKMPKYSFACFAAGTINVFLAGFLKALWKLLYAAGVCDFQVFNTMFLPTQSIGFLLAGLGIVIMFFGRKSAVLAAAPPVFRGTMLFIPMMVFGLAAICASLSVLAFRLKKKGAAILFVLNLVFCMGMGYLASRDGSTADMNWIEQSVNCFGQAFLLWGALILHKAGLREIKL